MGEAFTFSRLVFRFYPATFYMEDESRPVAWKDKLLNEAIMIAVATALGYAGVYQAHVGVAQYFEVPANIISIDTGHVIVVAILELLVLGGVMLIAPALYSGTNWVKTKTGLPLVEVIILPAVVAIVWFVPMGYFAKAVGNFFVSFLTLIVAFTSLYGNKARSSFGLNFDSIWACVCLCGFVLGFLLFFGSLGRLIAESHNGGYIFSHEGADYFLVDKYDETFVLKKVDLQAKTFSSETMFLKLEDGKGLVLKRVADIHFVKSAEEKK